MMKQRFLLLLPATALLLYLLAFSTLIHWSPGDRIAALAWNLGLVLAPPLAMLAQWKIARERGFPLISTLSVIAVVNTALVVGSRLGAWTGSDWRQILHAGVLPELPGKTVMGGLVLALALFFILKKWWCFSFGMADVLVMGMPLAAVTARMGCLIAGCCYGEETGSGWGICYGPGTPAFQAQYNYPEPAVFGGFTSALYPVQLLFIAGNLFVFYLLWHFRTHLLRPGALALLGLGLLMAQRFGLEFIRDVATNRGELGRMLWGLKMVQWQSLLIGVVALAGWAYLQFFKKQRLAPASRKSPMGHRSWGQTLMVLLLIAGSYALQSLLTLDETLLILVSCLPALGAMAWQVWKNRRQEKGWMVQLGFLSTGLLLLTGNPIDTTGIEPGPKKWKQWLELGGGGAWGKITHKEVGRDCDGNTISTDEFTIKTGYAGGELSYNWANETEKIQIAGKMASGHYEVRSDGTPHPISTNRFVASGLSARFDSKYLGFSLGFIHWKRPFNNYFRNGDMEDRLLPAVSLRFGQLKRISIDCRVYDDPMVGLALEPALSLGMSYGFKDISGDTYLRGGFAFPSTYVFRDDSGTFLASGAFPIVKGSLYGSASVYLGDINMVNAGLRYRLNTKKE